MQKFSRISVMAVALATSTVPASSATIVTPSSGTTIIASGGFKLYMYGYLVANCKVVMTGISDLDGVTFTSAATDPRDGTSNCIDVIQFPIRMDVTHWTYTGSTVLVPSITMNTPVGTCQASNVVFSWSNLTSAARNFNFPIPPFCSGEFEVFTSPALYVN